jgi:BolA protein
MTVAESIRKKLTKALSPSELQIEDESVKHAGHAGTRRGGETHFRVLVVSDAFEGATRVARHRQVYAILGAELEGSIHALALTTLTPEEAGKT